MTGRRIAPHHLSVAALEQADAIELVRGSGIGHIDQMDGEAAGNSVIGKRIGEEALEFGKRLVSPEAREAFTAFFEKRKPDFTQFS